MVMFWHGSSEIATSPNGTAAATLFSPSKVNIVPLGASRRLAIFSGLVTKELELVEAVATALD